MMLFLLLAMSQSPGEYIFVVDGKPASPHVVSLQGPEARPSAGDLVYIRWLPIVLDGPGTYRFRTSPEEDGRLFRVEDDGSERVVGAEVEWTYEDDKKVVFDPLARLSRKELAGLRGVRMDFWPAGTEERLGLLDPSRACVVVTDNTHQKGKLPPLPPKLRYLVIHESSNSGFKDLSGLSTQKDLLLLRADLMTASSFDVAWIKANAGLKHLDLGRTPLLNASDLSGLKGLRILDLSWNEDLKDLRFAAGLEALASLDIRRTGVEDLSPLEGLEKLASVNADMTPLRTLPRKVPALKTLRVMSTRLTDPDVAAFRSANPGCRVHHRWDAALKEALEKADRVRVRSGGTCHRNADGEKTLADVKEAGEIRALVERLKVDESGSGFHCMCCGEPSFEFYRGAELTATLGFHHGQSMRWSGGWPGDGLMTPECADFVVEWLDQRGVRGPAEERRRGRLREAAQRRRAEQYREILGEGPYASLVESPADAAKILEAAAADPAGRAKLYLRLFGGDGRSWNLYAGLDSMLQKTLLPGLEASAVASALAGLIADKGDLEGAARWMFQEGAAARYGVEDRKVWLVALAHVGLSRFREVNRRRTIRTLVELKDPLAVEPLRAFLAGELKPKSLREEDLFEPGGMVSVSPDHSDLPEEASESAWAAFALASLGDKTSLASIRALREKASGKDRAVFDRALQLLEK